MCEKGWKKLKLTNNANRCRRQKYILDSTRPRLVLPTGSAVTAAFSTVKDVYNK